MKYHNAMSFQRFLAYIIDYFIIMIVATFILGFIPLYVAQSEIMFDAYETLLYTMEMTDLTLAITLLKSASICILLQCAVFIPLILAYQVILPIFWKHQTLGRLVAGVRVMKLTKDEKPSVGSLLVRELVGGFIFNTLFAQSLVFPILNYVFSRNRGRSLSDMISKTRLVDYKLAKAQSEIFGNTFEEPKNEDFINAEYKEVYKQNEEEVETEYKVF